MIPNRRDARCGGCHCWLVQQCRCVIDVMTCLHRKKVKHYDEPGHCHELTFSCYRRLPLLTNDSWRTLFCQSIERAAERHGYDRNLTSPKAILSAIDDIHENPVRRGLCRRAVDWKWSSARHYLDPEDPGDPELPRIHSMSPELLDEGTAM